MKLCKIKGTLDEITSYPHIILKFGIHLRISFFNEINPLSVPVSKPNFYSLL